MEDFATFSREGVVWMVVPTPLLVWELGNREAPSVAPSPYSRQSPAVGLRKFGEGRKEEKIPDRFHLSKPRMVPLEACKPFSSQIHLFIFLTCWPLLKATRSASPSHSVEPVPHPGPGGSGKVFGSPAMKAALSGRAWMPPLGREPVPAAAGAGGGSARRRWEERLGQCSGPRAAERAQCVPSVTHPGRRAAGSRRGERRRAPAGGAGCPGKGGEMDLISLECRQKGPRKEGGWEVVVSRGGGI